MQKLAAMKDKISQLPVEQQVELLDLLAELEEVENKSASKDDFISFVRLMWPSFISGAHHKKMADAFERVARGELKRLIINMPPRHTKSEFASFLLPAWFLGKYPEKKVIQTAHTAELAVGFGRKVRNLIQSDDFARKFLVALPCHQTRKLRVDGTQTSVVITLRLVLAVRLLVRVRIF